jgi:hypothetical protein
MQDSGTEFSFYIRELDQAYLDYLTFSSNMFRDTAYYFTGKEWTCMDDDKCSSESWCSIDYNSYYVMKGLYIGDYYWLSGIDSYAAA